MAKKIIISLMITVILSLTAFGAVYAYQKEKQDMEAKNEKEYGINYSSSENQPGEFPESVNLDDLQKEQDCPKNEERLRHNFRYREEQCDECENADSCRNEYQHQYRFENECNNNCEQECGGNEKSVQNQNKNSNKQNTGRGGK